MLLFWWGVLALGCGVCALFFLRFYVQTRDRLFAFFSAAFAVLGSSWVSLAFSQPAIETVYYYYLLRLAAFLLIIVGIIDKNQR